MSKLPRSREEAKAMGSTTYFTGNRCKHNHLAPRQTSNGQCKECRKLYDKKRDHSVYQSTDAYKEYQREYHKKYAKTERGSAIKAAAQERWREKQKIKKILKEHSDGKSD